MNPPAIGIIGGSGLYDIAGLAQVERVRLQTPFGAPSDEYLVGTLGGARLVFLPRHGRGHQILPHEINSRANIHGMKQLGVERILGFSAVGSMREEIRPGDLVIVDQYIDRTKTRVSSFFGDGAAGHVAFADPVCGVLGGHVATAAAAAVEQAGTGAQVHQGGTYLAIEGPQFSTRAESKVYRGWGISVIGMTALPEAKLAREAEICYSTVALATDYDCWHETEAPVTVDAVMAVMRKNIATARRVIELAAPLLTGARTCPCATAARGALMTDPATLSPELRGRLALIIGRHLETV
jgi:5'-methylthioadenosine phosphorylase